MKEKRKGKEIIGKPIKEYKLPVIERIAYYRSFIWFVFATILTAIIVAPTIMANYTNFWYYLLIAPVVFFFVLSLIKYIQFIFFANRMKAKIEETVDNGVSAEIDSGAPGTGKTLDAMYLSHEVSKANWHKLKYKMWRLGRKLKNKNYEPNQDEQEIIEAYNFAVNGKGVPCWSTNIPAYSKRYKRFAYIVDASYLKQEKRVPYRMCSVYDEIGTILSLELKDGRKTNEGGATDISDTARFCRHFAKWRIWGCEQDQNNVYKDVRRVVGQIRVYDGKKWLLKPRFLCWLFDKLENYFTNKMYLWHSIVFGRFMDMLENYINYCGFFKFTYKLRSNTETGAGVLSIDTGEKSFVYVPRASEILYRTRVFREACKAKDKSLDMQVWDSLYMTKEYARSMLKSENLPKQKK